MSGKIDPAAKERIVLRLLTEAADAGAACPSNDEICLAIDAKSWASASRLVALLDAKGLISVKRTQNLRRVTILATGKSTSDMPTPRQRRPHPDRARLDSGLPLSEVEICARRDANVTRHRAHEDHWLTIEAEKYALPQKARPISDMPA